MKQHNSYEGLPSSLAEPRQNKYRPSILGLDVIKSAHAVTTEPVRVHPKKHWMSERYHSRIQKKWNKRFGIESKPAAYIMEDKMLVHPAIYDDLVREINGREILTKPKLHQVEKMRFHPSYGIPIERKSGDAPKMRFQGLDPMLRVNGGTVSISALCP